MSEAGEGAGEGLQLYVWQSHRRGFPSFSVMAKDLAAGRAAVEAEASAGTGMLTGWDDEYSIHMLGEGVVFVQDHA